MLLADLLSPNHFTHHLPSLYYFVRSLISGRLLTSVLLGVTRKSTGTSSTHHAGQRGCDRRQSNARSTRIPEHKPGKLNGYHTSRRRRVPMVSPLHTTTPIIQRAFYRSPELRSAILAAISICRSMHIISTTGRFSITRHVIGTCNANMGKGLDLVLHRGRCQSDKRHQSGSGTGRSNRGHTGKGAQASTQY